MLRLTVSLVIGMIGMIGVSAAGPMVIGRTPVLSATLPAGTTWQVELREGPTAWVGSRVLIGGTGLPVSVRMDAWPSAADYRFQAVAGTVVPIAPALGTAWHIAGQEPGAEQIQIQRSVDLAAWGHEALLFPGLDGRYVRALREPLGARGFFRARAPALPTGDASATSHTPAPNYAGAAGFGPVYDDMPPIFQNGFIGALSPPEYHRGGENAAAAGECYELAGPFGRTKVIISDLTSAPAGTVEVGRSFFDLGPNSFAALGGGPSGGSLTAGVRLVPAPVTGNLKLLVVGNSDGYYTELRAYNHRAGVKKLEVKSSGSATWIDVPRTTYNSFLHIAAGSVPRLIFPVEVRVTSRFGEVVSFPPILSMTAGQRITGPGQFAVFPELAPVPEHRIRPAYVDRLSSVPGDRWSAGGYGGATVTEVDAAVAYEGTASMRISGLGNFAGVTFSQYPGFARPEDGLMDLAIRSASPVAADQVLLTVNGLTAGGTAVSSATVQLPALSGSWQVFQIPLAASGAPPVITGISLLSRREVLPVVWVDSVSFETR